MTEWNWDDALDFRYNEGIGVGMEKGIEKGQESALELLNQGLSVQEIKDRLSLNKKDM